MTVLLIVFLFVLLGLFLLFKGVRIVQEEERMVTEFLGSFHRIKGPGIRFNFPGIIRERARVSVWEQTVDLFEESIKIDFKNGSAAPKNARAFVRIKENPDDIYRVIYAVRNWRLQLTDLLENALRSYLNSMTIEEGLERGRAGYDFIQALPKTRRDGVLKAIQAWGIELKRVTVEDFELDETVIKAREDVLRAERAQAAAEHQAVQRALQSGGVHGEIVRILTGDPYRYSREDAERLAREYVLYLQGTETGRIIDWRGGGDLESMVARIIAAVEATRRTLKE